MVIGPGELLARSGLRADRVTWVSGRPPAGPLEATVRIRYQGEDAEGVVTPEGPAGARVAFRSPQRAVAPGQSVAFYAADEVLGGGRILEAVR